MILYNKGKSSVKRKIQAFELYVNKNWFSNLRMKSLKL